MTRRRVRRPAVAGMFYPADPDDLRRMVDGYLDAAAPEAHPSAPKAIIAPHAGYIYSGPVAGSVYRRLRDARPAIDRVVLLGPAHRVAVQGLAVPTVDAFATPLGEIEIDHAATAAASRLPQVIRDDRPHRDEHSLEVHLPFLQRSLSPGWKLAPFVVGPTPARDVAEVIDQLWGGPETLVVASTDLSHYLAYDEAAERDAATVAAIVDGAVDRIGPYDACGAHPVKGLLTSARNHGLEVTALDVRNSGDTAGSRDRVVGYGAFELV